MEWSRKKVQYGGCGRLALVAATASDARDVIVEGESGFLEKATNDFRPKYEPSKCRLTWPNGAQAFTYSAEEPERLRGKQHHDAWMDDLAAWSKHTITQTYDMLLFGLRLGKHPQTCITTTPKPVPLIRELIKSAREQEKKAIETGIIPAIWMTRGSTYDNRANLADSFFQNTVDRYIGTRLGRQEIDGELLDDILGALWTHTIIDASRVKVHPDLSRIVVAVDPSGGDQEGNDEQGIIVAGKSMGSDPRAYVLADYSGHYTPNGWGRKACHAWLTHKADAVVIETNYGGDMAIETVKGAAAQMTREGFAMQGIRVKKLTASRGKAVRAEPVSALYEQGRVHHVGTFPHLESQMATWIPGNASPDRMDALVWAITDLVVQGRELSWS